MLVAFAREDADLILWGVGGLAAVLSLLLLIRTAWQQVRNSWPTAAKVIAWPFRACRWLLGFVLVRAPRWTWRQAWRDRHGVTRGPATRAGARARGWVVAVLEPQFVQVRDAARAQHDEQNRKLDTQNLKLADVDGKLEGIDGRLVAIEELVTAPRVRRSTTTTVEEIPAAPPRAPTKGTK